MSNAYSCNVVVDLEFTPVPRGKQVGGLAEEVIEVGAVKLAPDGRVLGEFESMVKPTMAARVSGVVHRITGIGDEDLVAAKPFDEVMASFASWIGPGRARMVTWSNNDLKQIRLESAAKNVKVELPNRWLDIQRLYPRLSGVGKRRSMVALGAAADWCGVHNDPSSAHRALYDAQMTAEIFRMMMAGEFVDHRKRLQAELEKGESEQTFSANIAERCSGMAELLARLRAQEALQAVGA